MSKYRIYAIYSAEKFLGEFDAVTQEEAEDQAMQKSRVFLCHECAKKIGLSDVCELDVELIEE